MLPTVSSNSVSLILSRLRRTSIQEKDKLSLCQLQTLDARLVMASIEQVDTGAYSRERMHQAGIDKSKYSTLFDSIPQSGIKCDILFLVIRNRIQEEPEYVKRLRVVFQFNITKNAKPVATWTCDTRTATEGDVYRSIPKLGLKADCILTVDDDDWVRIMVGKLNPQRAFLMSKLKVRGNIMLLQKLYAIWFELRRKGKTPELDLIQEIMVSEPLMIGLKSEAMAIEIVQRIVKMPHLIENLSANIQMTIKKHNTIMTHYYIGIRPDQKPLFKRLPLEPKDSVSSSDYVFITVDDDDLVLILYGIYKIQDAIEDGRLEVQGSQRVSERAIALLEQPPIMARL